MKSGFRVIECAAFVGRWVLSTPKGKVSVIETLTVLSIARPMRDTIAW
jgi:hypothetical protein